MTIGHIYRAFGGGGMPRGTGAILEAQHAMGHDLVVFTREPRSENDFDINVPFRHYVIGGVGTDREALAQRLENLRKAVLESRCDLVIEHEYYAGFALDDLQLLKDMGVPALVQWHSCFSALNMIKSWDGRVFRQIDGVCRLSRGVMTLSRTDKAFFELMGVPAVHVPYSDPDLFDSVPVHGDGHNILWTGRFAASKRPIHALQIMELVLKRFPDATLTLLGDGPRRAEVDAYLAAHPDLAAHVSAPGFINDIVPYLSKADVFLVTTEYEGFMHSLVEAKMAALPIVGYQMDYLDTTRPGTGYCSVPQGHVERAAEEICRLFENPEERHRLGALARKNFEWFLKLDQKALYENAFAMALDRPASAPVTVTDPTLVPDIVRILLEHVDMHGQSRLKEFAAQKTKLQAKLVARNVKVLRLKKAVRRLRRDRAYRLGTFLLKPLRFVKRMLKRG